MPTYTEPLEQIYKNDYSSSPDADADEGADKPFPVWIEGVDTTYAPYLPTSLRRVQKCLVMASASPSDTLLDLGSGDGRFCSIAIRDFNIKHAIGVESDEELVDISRELARRALRTTESGEGQSNSDLSSHCKFHAADLRDASVSSVIHSPDISILIVFMSPEFAREHEPLIMEHYERGCRIVSGVFNMSDLKGLQLKCKDDLDSIWVYEKPRS
ncbi:hypothetical protein HDV00_003262 [Rhizophlyctis rosea]|nr:hypothetical protein HDV00_003262 [Rhizophlyctis rosea]